MKERGEGKNMKQKKKLCAALTAMFIISILASVVTYVAAPPIALVYVDDYEFYDETDLTGIEFNVTVNVADVADLGVWEFKLGYNTTLLDAVEVYPTPITEICTDWLPFDPEIGWNPINDAIGQVWCGALFEWGQEFTGSGALVTITFRITLAPPRDYAPPENITYSCDLHLYDVSLGDEWGDPITFDTDDGSYSYTRPQIPVVYEPPVAIFTESAETVDTGVVITFDASGSYDPDGGDIVSYDWDFGDVTSATGVIVEHAYADDGVYTVTLTVTDDEGATNSTTSTKTVLNRPPVASFTWIPETPVVGETVYFTSTSTDPDGTIVSWDWAFGDGTFGAGETTTHVYAMEGTYTVTLTVTDDDDATDDATAAITISKLVVLVPDLVRRSAWPDRHHFVEAKHGTTNTLYARMGNKYGTEAYDVYVKFSVYSVAKGIDWLGELTAGSEASPITLAAGEIPVDACAVFDIDDSRWATLAKVYVNAELFYWDGTDWVEGEKDKWFSFAIVRM